MAKLLSAWPSSQEDTGSGSVMGENGEDWNLTACQLPKGWALLKCHQSGNQMQGLQTTTEIMRDSETRFVKRLEELE
jgi:hypothetical protein